MLTMPWLIEQIRNFKNVKLSKSPITPEMWLQIFGFDEDNDNFLCYFWIDFYSNSTGKSCKLRENGRLFKILKKTWNSRENRKGSISGKHINNHRTHNFSPHPPNIYSDLSQS